ncbi:MAG: OmpW/AlkL family protein [Thermoanaerobaculia bacterium]
MKRLSLAVAVALVSLAAVPAFAADRFFDLTGAAVWVDPNSSGTFNSANPNQPFDISFDGKLGYGIAANIFFTDAISIELAASEVRPEATFRTRPSGLATTGNDLKMIPLTAVLQWHFIPKGRIDPYIGAGAAYILFDQLGNADDVNNLGFSRIDFKDDAGLALNAGVGIGLTNNLAITLDGKYVPLKSSATAVYAVGPNTTTKVDINPVIFSAGLTLRF